MKSSNVSAVLFAKDLKRVATFYSRALGMTCSFSDEHHYALHGHGFDLIVQQIPKPLADATTVHQPPERRAGGAVRLDFPVQDIRDCRRTARLLGGEVDDAPPAWAGGNATFFLGHDPEGNVFGANQETV